MAERTSERTRLGKTLRQVRTWSLRGWTAIADQGVYSGSNFLLNILLARWLLAQDYGAFSVGFTGFLLVLGLYTALVLEPMSVLGPARHREHLAPYLRRLLGIHFGLALTSSIVICVLALVLFATGSPVATSILSLGAALPFILLLLFFRQACYLETRPERALAGSLLYAIALLLGLLVLRSAGWTSSYSGFLILAMASLAGSLVTWGLLGRQISGLNAAGPPLRWSDVIAEHWGYGKWIMVASIAHGVGNLLYLPLIGAFDGLGEAGALRAMQNLLVPLQQIQAALYLLLLPWIAKKRAENGNRYVREALPRVTGLNILLSGVYLAGVLHFGRRIVTLLYGNAPYEGYAWLIPFLAGAALIIALGQPLSLVLRAHERPSAIMWSKLGAALFACSVGLLLIWKWGLLGGAVSLIISALMEGIVMLQQVRRLWRETAHGQSIG